MPRIQAQCAQTVDKSPPAERFSANCATVIVPAHNEARGIAAAVHQASSAISCVNALPGFPNVELVIACNGCSDDTALIARQAAPCAQVLDLAARGKAGALNVALAASPAGPVLVVDADVSLNALVLATLLEALTDEDVLAVSPAVQFALDGVSVPVRAYYRTFAYHPYLATGVGGAGIYGLSARARERLGKFPAIAADDEYVRRSFPANTQRRIHRTLAGQPISVTIRPPGTLADLLRTEIRTRNGDRAVSSLRAGPCAKPGVAWLWVALRASPRDCMVFLAIKFAARLFMRFSRSGRADGWATARR